MLASVRRDLADASGGPASRDLTSLVAEVIAILPQYSPDAACTALVEADEDVQKAVDLLISRPLPGGKGGAKANKGSSQVRALAAHTSSVPQANAGIKGMGLAASKGGKSSSSASPAPSPPSFEFISVVARKHQVRHPRNLASLGLEPVRMRSWSGGPVSGYGAAWRKRPDCKELLAGAFGAWWLEAARSQGGPGTSKKTPWLDSSPSVTRGRSTATHGGAGADEENCNVRTRSPSFEVHEAAAAYGAFWHPDNDHNINPVPAQEALPSEAWVPSFFHQVGGPSHGGTTHTPGFFDEINGGGFETGAANPAGCNMTLVSTTPGGSAPAVGSGGPSEGYHTVAMPCVQIPPAPCALSDLNDRQIIEGLAASDRTHMRLLRAAHEVRALLCQATLSGKRHSVWVELYGSLALYGPQQGDNSVWQQDWSRHYVRVSSDIDLVVLLNEGALATDIVNSLVHDHNWTLLNQTHVPKFAITQFTLLGNSDGHVLGNGQTTHKTHQPLLDLTCIDQADAYHRFKRRQEAFMHTFKHVRANLAYNYGQNGALAFDTYIYLLKGFAQKLPANAMTGFQATCFGLFCLQLGLYELKCCEPTGLLLFECFLRFCSTFFFDGATEKTSKLRNYKHNAIDLSLGARMLPRMSTVWQCEAYFLTCEVQMQVESSGRVNIAHSVDPRAVCIAARETLMSTLMIDKGELIRKPPE